MHIDVVEPIRVVSSNARPRPLLSRHNTSESLSLEAVFEVAKLITGAADPVKAMPAVFTILNSFMGLCDGALALLVEKPENSACRPVPNPFVFSATGRGTAPQPASSNALPEKIVATVFKTGLPLVSLHVEDEFGKGALPKHLAGSKLAAIAAPIRADAESPLVIGVLGAYRPFFDDPARDVSNDLRVMTMIASLIEQSLRFRRSVARDRERMIREAGDALKAAQAERQNAESAIPIEAVDGIIGNSEAIGAVIKRVSKVAKTSAQVLLRGESGTGKELFARALHTLSDRKDKPFVTVNCAALSDTLLETELFGHEKGSFTGAVGQKKGRFELADGGTLFLDEIGEINHEFQTKLLRVLQEGEFERVGGTRTLKVDVRLITATNRDLEQAVARGKFRADLYFRICVVPIQLPPLRERSSDIPALAQTFLDRFNMENGTNLNLSKSALDTLVGCQFPGNVRELENCINRTAALCDGDVIDALDMACKQDACFSAELWRLQDNNSSPIGGLAAGDVVYAMDGGFRQSQPESRPALPVQPQRKTADTERDELVEAMEQAGWVQAKAARLLGMTPRQVGYALKKHEIPLKRF